MLTQEEKEKIKQLVYASTRYEKPQEEGNFPNPEVIDKLIEMETERYNIKLKELKGRKAKLQSDKDMLMNLTNEDIAELSTRTQQWLSHAIPKYQQIVDELQAEEEKSNE